MRPLKASHPSRSYSGSLAAPPPFSSSPAGAGGPSPPLCRGSRGSPSRLLRQRQVRGPNPAAVRSDLRGRETPRKTAKPPRQEGRDSRAGRESSAGAAGRLQVSSSPAGRDRSSAGFSSPKPMLFGGAGASLPRGRLYLRNRRLERTEPRSAPGITGDEPSGAARRFWCWDIFVVVVISFLFSSSWHSFSLNTPEQRERSARGDARRGAAHPRLGPPRTGNRLSPKTAGLGFSWNGDLISNRFH